MQVRDTPADHGLDPDIPFQPLPEDSPHGIMGRRYIAAVFDNIFACIGALVVAKQFPDSLLPIQISAMVICYLAYYLISEGIFYTSPVKYMFGLTVRNFAGGCCSFRQTLIRTLFRFVEVNPLLIGGIPAAISILLSRDNQRIGDKIARTVVVHR